MGISKAYVIYGYLQSIPFSVKRKKPPVCLSGGMTKVQGVRHSLKRKQKDEDHEMQPQPEVAYYQSCELRMLSLRNSYFTVHAWECKHCIFKLKYTCVRKHIESIL